MQRMSSNRHDCDVLSGGGGCGTDRPSDQRIGAGEHRQGGAILSGERGHACAVECCPQKFCALSATCPTRASWNKADDAIRKALSKIYV